MWLTLMRKYDEGRSSSYLILSEICTKYDFFKTHRFDKCYMAHDGSNEAPT